MADSTAVAPQYHDMEQERDAASLGMWTFLVTEVLFFGVLFAGYTVGRILYPHAWAAASRHTVVWIGTVNTGILLTSSLFMALAVRFAHVGHRKAVTRCLLATITLGVVFMVLKGLEYYLDYRDHMVPDLNFVFPGPYSHPAELFWFLYFFMTGLHGIHVTIGICVIGVLAWMNAHGKFTREYFTPIEITGLYWHFVDIVWIFLYPLIYLVNRS